MKKWIALLLVLALSCCLFAGCSKAEETVSSAAETVSDTAAQAAETVTEAATDAAQTVEAAAEEAAAPEAAPEATPEAPAAESGPEASEAPEPPAAPEAPETPEAPAPAASGYDYTWTAVVPDDAPETITMLSTEVNIMGALGELGLTQFGQFDYWPILVEKTNVDVDVDYISFMVWSEQYQLFIAAGDYTDLVKGGDYTGGLEQGVEDDYLFDFTDYVQDLMPNYYNRLLDYGYLEEATLNGKFLQVCSMYDEYKENQGLLIRQDWLDDLGYDVPQSWDDFFNVLKGFVDNYHCDWPVYICKELTMTNFGGYEVPFQGGESSDITFFQDHGTVIPSITTQEQKDYITWLHNSWEAGILNRDFISTTSNVTSPNFNNIVATGEIGLWRSSIEGLSTLVGMDLPEGFRVSAIVGPHEGDDIVSKNSDVTMTDSTGTIMTVEAEDNKEAVMSWLDFWYSDDGVLLHNYGVEGVDYTLNDEGKPEFTDFVVNNSYGLSASNFLRCRTPYGTLTGLAVRTRTAFEYSQQQLDAWDLWTSTTGTGERVIPSNATVPTELSNEYTNLASDLAVICNEWLAHFVLGNRDIEGQWDEFQQALVDGGLERVTEIKQIAYDTYEANVIG